MLLNSRIVGYPEVGRDIPAELAMFTEALTLKFSTAQRLLNGDE
jgi:hypothetical protein